MRLKKYSQGVIVGAFSCLLAACAGNPPSQAIHDSLSADIAQNQRLAAQTKTTPQPVLAALTPGVETPKSGVNPQDQRFDVTVNNIPAATFFAQLVAGTPYNIVVSPKVTGTITLNLKHVTIQQVLDTVQNIYGYQYQVKPHGYEIYPFDLETRIFKINYINLVRKGTSSSMVSSSDISQTSSSSNSASSGSSSSTTSSSLPAATVHSSHTHDLWKQINDSLRAMVGTEGGRQVVVNPEAGMIYIKADPDQMKIVTQYLDSMQATVVRQVIIEAKIIEVTLNNRYDAGIDWSMLGNSVSQSGLYARGTAKAQEFPGAPAFNSIFQVQATAGNDFNMVINALATQGNVQVLSSPRVSALNNQQAVIKIGTDQFYVTGVESSTTSSTSTTSTQNVILTPFFSGIALGVTPQISEEGVVTLQLHPIVSNVTTENKKFMVNGVENDLPLAKSEVRETDTIVSARDGQVIVIGGLMQDSANENLAETPGLGSIPYVGALFRRTQQAGTKSELVILLRPIVVTNSSNIEQLQQTQKRLQDLNRGFHVGGYPQVFGTQGEHEQN